ncbi:hypothetical protein ACFLVE_02895 [Chloroflexota bacterium]
MGKLASIVIKPSLYAMIARKEMRKRTPIVFRKGIEFFIFVVNKNRLVLDNKSVVWDCLITFPFPFSKKWNI